MEQGIERRTELFSYFTSNRYAAARQRQYQYVRTIGRFGQPDAKCSPASVRSRKITIYSERPLWFMLRPFLF